MTKVQALITNGLLRMVELAETPDEVLTAEYVISIWSLRPDLDSFYQGTKRTSRFYKTSTNGSGFTRAFDEQHGGRGRICCRFGLFRSSLPSASDPVAAQIQKGASSARSDDTKGLKGAVLDWITPRGQPLNPALSRNVKIDRGFHHERTGALLCPSGLDWSNTE
jgi:hypothetical protein